MKIETKLVTDKEGLHTLHTSIQSHGERVRNSYDNCEEANERVSEFIFEQNKPKDDHDERDMMENMAEETVEESKIRVSRTDMVETTYSDESSPPLMDISSQTDVVETDNSKYSDESSPIPLMDTSSQQSDTNIRKPASSLAEVQIDKVPKTKKYIDRDIANEVLNMYQTSVLPALFIALPSSAKASITNIETYSIQSNGFRLTISASKYLFEDIIIKMDLQDVEVPRTIEGFSNLVMAVKENEGIVGVIGLEYVGVSTDGVTGLDIGEEFSNNCAISDDFSEDDFLDTISGLEIVMNSLPSSFSIFFRRL
ncbi:hypothetical protein C1646_669400 [Rhizophagus diaphanus]|nr:hypothetical protein C1646_669400 [Rhizophagus diaphanus] [Rhizophagus sp. MUCL 43196]